MKRDNDNYYSPKPYDVYRNASKVMEGESDNGIYSKLEDDNFFREIELENKRYEGILDDEPLVTEEFLEETPEPVVEQPSEPANVVAQPKEEKHYYSIYDEIAERRRKQKAGLGLYKNSEPAPTVSAENVAKEEKDASTNEIYSRSSTYEEPEDNSSYYDDYDVEDDGAYRDYHNTYEKKSHKGLIALIIILAVVVIGVGVGVYAYFAGWLNFGNNNQQTEPATIQSTESATEEVVQDDLLDNSLYKRSTPVDMGDDGYFENNLYIWNNQVFELFYGDTSSAQNYAKTINGCADALEGVTVYNMLVPTSTEINLPERFVTSGAVETNIQSEFISTVYSNLADNVTGINCYNYLSQNVNEYLYFAGDRNWTGLGGYYGYKAFADKLNLPQLDIKTCQEKSVEGYVGALSRDVTAEIPTDMVCYWTLPYDVTNTIYEDVKGTGQVGELYYSGAAEGAYTYSLFLQDNSTPLCVLTSKSDKAQGKIAVVKDSLGNAFAPYLTYNYSEVHVIDASYATGDLNLAKYVAKNDIDTVLFINSVRSASYEGLVSNIAGLTK